jgi:uncharacterized protein YdeI (YjbR/CyaY-like superfamily)
MPTKTDPRFDSHIAKAAPFAQPILRHLRKLVHTACPDAVETIKWNFPSFTYGGQILCMLGAFKAHAMFGFWHAGMKKIIAKDRGPVGNAMGALGRLTSLADLPNDKTLLRYIKIAAALNASGAPARARPKAPRKPLPVPADLAAALRKNRAAAKTFEEFPPGCRREYIEWITEAKRSETRATRLATTLAWLAEGKRRNWKYKNC